MSSRHRLRIARWLLPRGHTRCVAVLRVGIAVEVIWYCLSLRHDWLDFFSLSSSGPIKRDIFEAIIADRSGWTLTIGALVRSFGVCGIGEHTALTAIWWCLIVAGAALLAGLFTREASVVAWLLHLAAVKSSGSLAYGVDNLTTIGLFYLVLAPSPDKYSLDYIWRHRRAKSARLHGLLCRVLQLHLCVIYGSSGVTKIAGAGWWDGSALWRALIRPPFNQVSPDVLARWYFVFPAAAVAVWVIECGYPVLIWLRPTRTTWLALTIAMHVGIGVMMGLYSFALVMITLNLAAFGYLPLSRRVPAAI